MMLDIARNFTKKADLLKLINQLAAYKINVLHFQFSDDEAWRLEIPGLEELTAIGSRRGFTEDESQCLYPVYYRRLESKRYHSHGKRILYPRRFHRGTAIRCKTTHHRHTRNRIAGTCARAAIKAMEARFNRLKGEDMEKAQGISPFQISADASKYVSAQAYTDNIMNVALPSVYRFMDKVSDEIIKMYKRCWRTFGNDSHRRRRSTPKGLGQVPRSATNSWRKKA